MPKNNKVAIVKANFNADITDKMLALAKKELLKKKIKFDVYEVSGAFEIPGKIKQINKNYSSFIAIGCLIKGETYHFEYISQAVVYGLMKLSIELTKPVLYCILNCQNKKQAIVRTNYIIHNINQNYARSNSKKR